MNLKSFFYKKVNSTNDLAIKKIKQGYLNGIIITTFKVHSFLSTIATSLVFRGLAILITGGFLIPVRMKEFTWLGREKIFCPK